MKNGFKELTLTLLNKKKQIKMRNVKGDQL